MKRIAIFASGGGGNAEAIMQFFEAQTPAKATVALIITNNEQAFVRERAHNHGVPEVFVPKATIYNHPEAVLELLDKARIDFIVLAGFMLLVPGAIIERFRGKIVNIHPALLPKFGGKGMYGDNVHRAVIEAHETQSGITIHYVNEHYDEGNIIFQATTPVTPDDTPDTLAAKIHTLEHKHFPQVISDSL